MLLQPCPPFDFAHTLRFILSPPALLNGRVFEPLVDHFQSGEYRRLIQLKGQPLLYGVSEVGTGKAKSLRIRILAGDRGAAAQRAVRALVSRQFAAEVDLEPFYRLAKQDQVLGKLVGRFRGMRIPQTPTVHESVVSAILEQQVNLTFAHQVKKALVEAYGAELKFDGQRYRAFPSPEALAGLTPDKLRPLQISGPKARYITGFSQAVARGEFDVDELRRLPEDTASARLLEHKGIGPWTAEYVGLRALGHQDRLPASDVGLQKAVGYFYRLRKLPDAARVEKIARKWAGWRSYATFYFWLTYWQPVEWKKVLLEEVYSGNRSRSR